MRLEDFLLARITEDEATARDACTADPGPRPGRWGAVETSDGGYRVVGEVPSPRYKRRTIAEPRKAVEVFHIARHDPARIIADCEAKRALVDFFRRTRR